MTPEIAIVLSGLLSGLLCGAYGFIQGIKYGQQNENVEDIKMETLKTLISNVLDNSESLCLDSSEDKNTLLDSIMGSLDLDDKTILLDLFLDNAEGADVQVDNDGQFIVYTNVYQED